MAAGALATGLVAMAFLIAPGAARAGELAYKGCISGNDQMGPKGSDMCSLIPAATLKGWDSGLGSLTSLAPSPDGRTLYSGAAIDCLGLDNPRCLIDAAVGRFHIASRNDALRYRGCVTGNSDNGHGGSADCTAVPNATPHALGAGLGAVTSEAVSPDGRFLYAGSEQLICASNDAGTVCYGSNVVTTFSVDADSGALTYVGCVTGDRRSGPSGGGACAQIPHATADGRHSGLDGPLRLAVSQDGRSLYAASEGDSSVARFNRNPTTGAITYMGCITGDDMNGPSGSGACAQIPSASQFGVNSGIENPTALALSPDGRSLYLASNVAVATFARDASTGALTYRGCLTGDKREGPSGSNACAETRSATKTGSRSGLDGLLSLAPSPDGKSLYAGGYVSVTTLDRNRTTGAISYDRCLTGYDGPRSSTDACRLVRGAHNDAALSGLGNYVAVHGDKTLYAGVDAGVAHLKRDPATGTLSFRDCVAAYEKDERSVCSRIPRHTPPKKSPGLGFILSLAPIDNSVYAGVFRATVAHFALAPETKISGRPGGTTGKHRILLRFRASQPSTFECKLMGKGVESKLRHWRRCGSHGLKKRGKERYRHLGSGKKVFEVKATDGANTTDPTPAKRRWHVG